MKTLIIDTSTRQNWVALFEDDRLCGCIHFEDRQSCLINLTSSIDQVLHNTGFRLQHLDRIGAIVGPGAWSSLRIGLATVKQLCIVNGIPLVTNSSSRVNADYARQHGVTRPALLTAIDAGSGKLYTALFTWNGEDYQQVEPDRWQAVADALATLQTFSNLAIVGDGAKQFENYRLPEWQLVQAFPQADSRYLHQIAERVLTTEPIDTDGIRLLKPLYVQPSSAEIEFKVQVT